MSFFQNFFNFSLNKFLKNPWQDFGVPLRADAPPPAPPRYATDCILIAPFGVLFKDVCKYN